MSALEPIPVRILKEEEEPTAIEITEPIKRPSYNLLVPIPGDLELGSTLQIRRFLRTSLAVARNFGGSITIAGVVTAPSDIPLNEERADNELASILESIIATAQKNIIQMINEVAELEPGITANGVVGVSHLPETVITKLCNEGSYDGIFLARGPANKSLRWESSFVEAISDTAPCATFIESIGDRNEVSPQQTTGSETSAKDSESTSDNPPGILLAVGTGPHSVLSAETARAVAQVTDMKVTALHFLETDSDAHTRRRGREMLSLAEYVLMDVPEVECVLRETDDVVNGLLAEIEEFDVAIIGAPTTPSLRDRLFRTKVSDEIVDHVSTSTIVVRQPDAAVDTVYYRWKRAIERTREEAEPEGRDTV